MFSTDRIKFYQKGLNTLDYAVGKADGIIGIKTQRGIRAFQSDRSLTVDGVMGPVSTHRLITELVKLNKNITPDNLREIIANSDDLIA